MPQSEWSKKQVVWCLATIDDGDEEVTLYPITSYTRSKVIRFAEERWGMKWAKMHRGTVFGAFRAVKVRLALVQSPDNPINQGGVT